MQNRYTGDIGDFGKYGLLRQLALQSEPRLRLGVVWYLTPDEGHTGDGGQVSYLLPGHEQPFVECDEELYHHLRGLVMSGSRTVAATRVRGILPRGTVFFESLLVAGLPARTSLAVRGEWHEQALIATTPCDLVFLDPDNGVSVDETTASIKHAVASEILDYRRRGQSVVVYHHLHRNLGHVEQVTALAARLGDLSEGPAPVVLRTTRGSGRAFVILPSGAHEPLLRGRIADFLAGPWSGLFAQAA